jgi:hypothetical protein
VTDAWLRVQVVDSLRHRGTLTLSRNDSVIRTFATPPSDTTFIDENLLPKKSYTYRAKLLYDKFMIQNSEPLTITTMDTTSHDFTWEVDTLGDGASSVLWDVAIINDTLVYVVGEIHKKDSTGQFESEAYNVAWWNGKKWTLLRVPVRDYGGATYYIAINTVYGFSSNDVWFAAGADLIHWDGNAFLARAFFMTSLPFDGQVLKMWGTNRYNLYCVGRSGAIYHYNDGDSTWQKMESGTDVDLLDVWGSPDGRVVWACGWGDFTPTIFLKYEQSVWNTQYSDDLHRFIIRNDSLSGELVSGVAFNKNILYLLTSAGLFKSKYSTHGEGTRSSFSVDWFPGFPFRIRGNGINDIMIAGEYSMIAHYNGVNWMSYSHLMDNAGRLRSVDQRGRLAVAVGYLYDVANRRAIVYRGRR